MLATQGEVEAEPLNPLKVFHELSPRLPGRRHADRRLRLGDDLVGAPSALPARHARRALRHPGHHGPGVPYALAAKFVRPDRPVIAVEGDGAMQMLGINA